MYWTYVMVNENWNLAILLYATTKVHSVVSPSSNVAAKGIVIFIQFNIMQARPIPGWVRQQDNLAL